MEALGNPAEEQGARAKKRFDSVYTKLGVWGLTDYETVVFLDADMIVLRNVRHPLPTRPCPLPSPGPDACCFPVAQVAEMFDATPFAASAYEPYSSTLGASFFDSACMVLRPSLTTLASMRREALRLPSFDGGDAGFLNAFILGPGGCEPSKRAAVEEMGFAGGGGGLSWCAAPSLPRSGGFGLSWASPWGRATELPRSYNFTSHWVREASTADFAKLWAAEPAEDAEGGAGGLSSRLSVLHYPGQA